MNSNVHKQKKGKKNGMSKQKNPSTLRFNTTPGQTLITPNSTLRKYSGRSGPALRLIGEERIGPVLGNTTVGSTFYIVQPAYSVFLPTKFRVAQSYQRYRPRKLTIRYTPSVSGFATAGTTGQIVLSYMRDPGEEGPTTESQAMSVKDKAFGFITSSIELTIENVWDCDFLTNADYSTPGEPRLYHAGAFFATVIGTPNTSTIGNITVVYDIDFFDDISETVLAKISRDVNYYKVAHTGFTAGTNGVWTTIGTTWTETYPSVANTLVSANLTSGNFTVGPGVWVIEANMLMDTPSVSDTIIGAGIRIVNGSSGITLEQDMIQGAGSAGSWGLSVYNMHCSATVTVTANTVFLMQWFKTTIAAGTTVLVSGIDFSFRRIG
jgi:hypothetical protein